jgi:glycosyltransferase involved in cell wall biosynthesis
MISIVSSSHPEVDRLAAELCARGELDTYVRRYTYKGRAWEKLLLNMPLLKRQFSTSANRRQLLSGLLADKVTDVGICYDFLLAGVQLGRINAFSVKCCEILQSRRNAAIRRTGHRLLATADTVVGNYSVAAPTFENVKARGGRTILNYPNVHHRYARKLLAEEAEREPEFASTITFETTRLAPVYERECELADMILVGSSFVRDSFVSEGINGKEIVVIPYGSDTSMFSPPAIRESDGVFRAMFAGMLIQRKGISYLLRAYKAFHGPKTELMVVGRFVGDARPFDPYRSLIKYLGNLPHPELARAYRRADVFVFPTLLEGMPLVVLEAMASGLPVITTRNGPGDLVRDGIDGFLVPIRDPQAIAEKLEYLRLNPEIRAEMGRSARQRALQFTWQAYSEKAANTVLAFASSQPASQNKGLNKNLSMVNT